MTVLDDAQPSTTDPVGHDPAALVLAAVTAATRDGLSPEMIRAAVDLAAGDTTTGLATVPSVDEVRVLAGLAVTLTAAGNVPKAIRNAPNDAFLVMLEGRSLGLAPTTALRTLHVIDGKVTVPPMMKLAQLHRSGLGRAWKDPGSDEHGARWFAARADEEGLDVEHSSAFTWDDARRADLADPRCRTPNDHADAGKDRCRCKDNWRKYPARMLSWRALGYLLDDTFPEVGAGLYSPDELGAVTDEDGRAIDVTSWDAPHGLNRAAKATPAPPKAPTVMATDADVDELARAARALERQAPDDFADLRAWWGSGATAGCKIEPGHLTAAGAKAAAARLTMYARKLAMSLEELAGIAGPPAAQVIDTTAGEADGSTVDDGAPEFHLEQPTDTPGGGEAPDAVPGRCTVPDCKLPETADTPGLCAEHEPF